MGYVLTKKKHMESPEKKRESIKRELALAAGCGYASAGDPVRHVTENFRQSFDEIGRRHALGLAGRQDGGFSGSEAPSRSEQAVPDAESAGPGIYDPKSTRQPYRMRYPEYPEMLRCFSETAFQRGTLAGAVMAGTGRMMLVSCIRRAAGGSRPAAGQKRRLFEGGSRNIPGHTTDSVVFNRGFAESAVGLAVDTLKDARGIVETLAELASGGMDERDGAGTLRRIYPFLDDSRERRLREQYSVRLKETDDPDEKHLLQNACIHAGALIEKKAQMRNEFINKLRFIANRSEETLALFETEGFVDSVARDIDASPAPPLEEPENENPSDGDETDDDETG